MSKHIKNEDTVVFNSEDNWDNPEDWEKASDSELHNDLAFVDKIPQTTKRNPSDKPSRRRIEEYFEIKRLREALDEDVEENIFKA